MTEILHKRDFKSLLHETGGGAFLALQNQSTRIQNSLIEEVRASWRRVCLLSDPRLRTSPGHGARYEERLVTKDRA